MPHSEASSAARRRGVARLAGGAVAALLAGCTTGPPTPAPDAPVVAAVVSETQELRILDRVSDVVAADDTDEAAGLAARLSGPALVMREAELKLAAARGDRDRLTDLTPEMQQVLLPSERTWPRTSYGIGVQPEGRGTPVLVALEQAAAREQYKLWGYVQLLPDVTMPRFADPGLGSPAVAADDTTLRASPQAAVEQYASVLTVGDRSQYAEQFSDDDHLRQFLRDYGRLQVEAIEEKDGTGTFEVVYEPAESPVKAVRTVDGGALVLAALTSEETIRAEENWQLGPPTPSARALWGDAERTNLVRIVYRDMVALYVPSAGSADRIRLVGHHRVPSVVANS